VPTCLCAAVTAASLVCAVGSAATDRRHDDIVGFGNYTLARLGYGDQTLAVSPGMTRLSLPIRFSADAHEGHGSWYVVHVHAVVRFAANADRGTAYLTTAINNGAASLVRLRPTLSNGLVSIAWDTGGLIHGFRHNTAAGPSVEVRDENYAQSASIRGGDGTLTFALQQFEGVSLESVTVLDDSAIEHTPVGPGRLDARLEPSRRMSTLVGKPLRFGYHVWRVDGRPPEQVRVSMVSDDPNVRVSPASRDLGTLTSSTRGSFRFVAKRPTFTELELSVSSSSGYVEAYVYVHVKKRGGRP
jgi:hypothetical protein